jgi:hypothetical protein
LGQAIVSGPITLGVGALPGPAIAAHVGQAPGRSPAKALGGKAITGLTLVDVVDSPIPEGSPADSKAIVTDFSERGVATTLISDRPDVIFHLAAIVSGEAEQNFDLGYRINLHGTMELFAAIRAIGDGYRPRVVFTSSIAVYGAPFPDAIGPLDRLDPVPVRGVRPPRHPGPSVSRRTDPGRGPRPRGRIRRSAPMGRERRRPTST